MDRYILFVNTSTDYLMFPLRAFIGARYLSTTTIDLFFEKSPLAYKVTLTVETGTGISTALQIADIFNDATNSTIVFNDTISTWPIDNVTGIASFTKVVIK